MDWSTRFSRPARRPCRREPARTYPSYDVMNARRAFWLAVGVYAVLVLVAAITLPDQVPIHFDGAGHADRFTDRSGALGLMAASGAGTAALFWGLAVGASRLPMSLMNVPNHDWWAAKPQRVSFLRRLVRRELYVLGAGVMLLVTAVFGLIVRAAGMEQPSIQPWGWVVVLLFVAFVGVWLLRLLRLLRPER